MSRFSNTDSGDDFLARLKADREADAEAFRTHDGDLCMLCNSYGDDKRSLFIDCFYDLKEAVVEMLSLTEIPQERGRGFYLRICKTCRGDLIAALRVWADGCRARRGTPMDHDGGPENLDPDRNIPVRIDGRTVMLTTEEWHARNPDRDPIRFTPDA